MLKFKHRGCCVCRDRTCFNKTTISLCISLRPSYTRARWHLPCSRGWSTHTWPKQLDGSPFRCCIHAAQPACISWYTPYPQLPGCLSSTQMRGSNCLWSIFPASGRFGCACSVPGHLPVAAAAAVPHSRQTERLPANAAAQTQSPRSVWSWWSCISVRVQSTRS